MGARYYSQGCEKQGCTHKEISLVHRWHREFSDGGLIYGFQDTINPKNLRKIVVPSNVGLACSDGE